jgi:ribosomal-protein-alanine N-acetyltransferase
MSLIFHPMEEAHARRLISWRYDSPYDIYNLPAATIEVVSFLTDPHNAYYSMHNADGMLEAFCGFGADAQVPGGDYTADALDVGWGVRPDLTGRGCGLTYVTAILAFARQTFAPARFRTTVAAFNTRSRRVCEKAGFAQVQVFSARAGNRPFAVLTRDG